MRRGGLTRGRIRHAEQCRMSVPGVGIHSPSMNKDHGPVRDNSKPGMKQKRLVRGNVNFMGKYGGMSGTDMCNAGETR